MVIACKVVSPFVTDADTNPFVSAGSALVWINAEALLKTIGVIPFVRNVWFVALI